jgi:hypothetical protein
MNTLLLLTLLSATTAQWPDVCPNQVGGPYSSWNSTHCPSTTATCCGSGFNPSQVGCCPFPNAVCCPGKPGYTCCPSGNVCVHKAGASGAYSEVFTCVPATGANTTAASVCKGGPMLPMSTTLKNVICESTLQACIA